MGRFQYNKMTGALQEAAVEIQAPLAIQNTVVANAPMPPTADLAAPPARSRRLVGPGGVDTQANGGGATLFFYTVEEGQKVLCVHRNGRIEVLEGPVRVPRWSRTFRPMAHYVAHPGEFLVVRFRDGGQRHLAGPADCWLDPRIHLAVEREEAVLLSGNEAVVVYAEDAEAGEVTRRLVYGPASFVPGPGEWLHTFKWHGGAPRKVPGGLVFQKLWLKPDQMYHNVDDVRTADDAVLTVRLMIFFELTDIEQMLTHTHDPIGDFINAATSDVVEFVGRCDFDTFKSHTDKLNDLQTYKNLTARAQQCGYRIGKVVYRGYGAPPSLQQMHDQATDNRIRLQLERATELQAQELEDTKLDNTLRREERQREAEARAQEHRLELQGRALQAEAAAAAARRQTAREQERLDAEQRQALDQVETARREAHLRELGGLGVDLTRYLTQGRADRVVEVRGGGTPHLHIPDETR